MNKKSEIKIHKLPTKFSRGSAHFEGGRIVRPREFDVVEKLLRFGLYTDLWTCLDSNQEPPRYKLDALTVELHVQFVFYKTIIFLLSIQEQPVFSSPQIILDYSPKHISLLKPPRLLRRVKLAFYLGSLVPMSILRHQTLLLV